MEIPARELDPTQEIEGQQQTATLIPRPSVLAAPPSSGAQSARGRLSEFLSNLPDGSCLLAVPDGAGATEAAIDTFTDAPERAEQLGADYERVSGLRVRAKARRVSEAQCSTLLFARSLPQYPNFPLRLSLTAARIESGARLEGVVSGLRKDSVYLIIVDDEGKAQLLSAHTGERSSTVRFDAHMTLTDGPVDSEQLLVAIAADGPLQTIPTRPGMPAETYFSKLATEIIMNNRSIHYGITSFFVR